MTETTREAGFDRKKATWGLLLATFGVVLFLDQLEMFEVSIWDWWGLAMIGVGLVWIIVPNNREQIASGVTMVLIGLWALACASRWMGLTFTRSWPLLIAITGLEIVTKTWLVRSRRERRAAKEAGHA
jgi:hypothetical protein